MAQPYVGEIRMFAGNFPPAGWAFCDGRLLPISENDTLFTLIGTTFGGDGESTFALPDLRGRIPIHQGQGPGSGFSRVVGENGGTEQVTLTVPQLPPHALAAASTAAAASGSPAGNVAGDVSAQGLMIYGPTPDTDQSPAASHVSGGSQPHPNLMPSLCVNFIISLFGIFPTQS
jgi:microcystin-dependent protein